MWYTARGARCVMRSKKCLKVEGFKGLRLIGLVKGNRCAENGSRCVARGTRNV